MLARHSALKVCVPVFVPAGVMVINRQYLAPAIRVYD